MKPKTLTGLLVITFLIWFIPMEGKKLFPEQLGSSYIQWGSALISALLLPCGIFLSFYYFTTFSEHKKETGWTCLGFVTLFSATLAMYGVFTPMMIQMRNATDLLSSKDSVPLLVKKIYSEDTPEKKRAIMASLIYMTSGVTVPYKTEDGSYMTYRPSVKDEQNWIEAQEGERKVKQTEEILDWQLKQMPFLTSLYVSSFFLTFVVGISVLVCKNTKSEQGGAPKPTTGVVDHGRSAEIR